jgi:IPT/TIG domain
MSRTLSRFSMSVVLAASSVTAQVATSPKHVLVDHSLGGGGRAISTKFELVGAFGPSSKGVAPKGSKFALGAGFAAGLDVSIGSTPVVSTVLPRHPTMRGREALTIHGANLDAGTAPVLKIGGQPATILTRSKDKITARLPIQPAPGWRAVQLRSSLGTAALPRAVGALPMLESRPAAASGVPFAIAFRGTKGDVILWALGIGESAPVALPGIHYGLALNPAVLLILPGLSITSARGEFVLPFAATTYPTGTLFVQAVFSTSNPGYGPAAFSNVLRL